MTGKRFKLAFEDFDSWAILDTTGEYSDDEDYIDWLSGQKAVDVMNHFADENEQLKYENKNLEAILDDFMNICNRLQSNLNDKQTLNVARDMLQNMGVDLE